jgi:hypothetical protein
MYNIPPCLVVNTNQIGVHLVPTRGDRTWERKKAKHIQVPRIEDKRQITTIVSTSANGSMLLASCVPRHNKLNVPTHE